MPAKKTTYIDVELDFAEEQLATWKQYIMDNPINELKEKIAWKETKGGGTMPMVIETVGQQIKTLRETLREYLTLLKEIDAMRKAEETKKEAKGNSTVPHRMQHGNNQ